MQIFLFSSQLIKSYLLPHVDKYLSGYPSLCPKLGLYI